MQDKSLLDTLSKRHIYEKTLLWLEAAIAIIDFSECCEKNGSGIGYAIELNQKRDTARVKIINALREGII